MPDATTPSATPVFDSQRHRPLDAGRWDAGLVQTEIDAIAADFAAAVQPDGSWPTHPLEAEHRKPIWCQYDGAAGAVVALRLLRAAGHDAPDLSHLLPRIHAAYLRAPDHGLEAGLQLGEVGILAPAVAAGLADATLEARLERCLHDLLDHPAYETTSGQTGGLHAALTLFESTGDGRWADHARALAHALFEAWRTDHRAGEWHWRSDIFGSVRHYYGACHGVAGNAAALLRARDLLPVEWATFVLERATATLEAGAIRCGDDVNWPVSADASGERRLVQWCHGAGGVVAALCDAPRVVEGASARLDRLLVEAGETIWRAGPVAKGPGLCHGTSGNGQAFLALHRRTGDAVWLERARCFAMHGIGQRRRGRERHGQGKYTLWTGDGGFAVYLQQCLQQQDARASSPIPGLEAF